MLSVYFEIIFDDLTSEEILSENFPIDLSMFPEWNDESIRILVVFSRWWCNNDEMEDKISSRLRLRGVDNDTSVIAISVRESSQELMTVMTLWYDCGCNCDDYNE
jgi:hypothetical protein